MAVAMPMFYSAIPDSALNKEFYKDLVCRCNETLWHGRSCLDMRTRYTPGPPNASVGPDCGKFDPLPLDICRSCQSVFYSYFYHPNQVSGYLKFPLRKYCWHCLEAGKHPVIHPVYSRVPKTSPLDILLNPYVKPPTLEDLLDAALNI